MQELLPQLGLIGENVSGKCGLIKYPYAIS